MRFAPTAATEINKMLLPRRGEFMLWVLMPRTVPTADGVWPFRAQYGAWSGDWECAWLELLTH
ncbi:MAG: hypothetical protein J6R59_06145 [Paludibacteraceae bacterium]|nr:hypothetical protein [Paludibacteraceae bacterium]